MVSEVEGIADAGSRDKASFGEGSWTDAGPCLSLCGPWMTSIFGRKGITCVSIQRRGLQIAI